MRTSRCRTLWNEDRAAYVIAVHLDDPRSAEIAAAQGWDCLWVDLEHGPRCERDVEHMGRAAYRGGARFPHGVPDIMARPGKGEFMRLGRLLEAGATGILYPRCESAAEAREVVRWAKFPPLGERGFDGGNADNFYGGYESASYVAAANTAVWVAAQIESPAAVECAEEIASVPGVDLLFFGPADYSNLIGLTGQFTAPPVLAAMEKTARACRAAGIRFGTIANTPELHAAAAKAGCKLFAVGSDQGTLATGLRDLLQTVRARG